MGMLRPNLYSSPALPVTMRKTPSEAHVYTQLIIAPMIVDIFQSLAKTIEAMFHSLMACLLPCLGHFSSDSLQERSPDTMSSLYPDRPIKPLPKRRLRERLSPDVADSIKYPPAPATTAPLFYYPYSINGEEDARGGLYPVDRQRSDENDRNYISRRNGEEIDSDEEYRELPYRGRYARHSPDTAGRSYRYVQKPGSTNYPKPEPPPSTTSSADGYDSFENTNNKKKRKIPTPGDAGLSGIHLSKDLASLGISAPTDESVSREESVNGIPKYYGAGPIVAGQGISGPGRGRYGRSRNGRSPLRTLSEASNNWTNGRPAKQQQPPGKLNFEATAGLWTKTNTISGKPTGIISTAIANAEKSPATPSRGQENISLLQQQASKKSSPATAQFTFTCDSQVPGTTWPAHGATNANLHQNSAPRGMSTQGTQTSPKVPTTPGQARQGMASSQFAPNASKENGKQSIPVKKPRRRAGKEYLIAARRRREQQEDQNYHHPPAPEDEWICEFCEYERIFGTPPEALIRQYEIKDSRVRKQEAERRRLLEKAKMKGRKGKKGNKLAAKNVAAAHDRQAHHQQAQQQASASQSQGTQSEEYYEDEYDEDYAREEPPLSPTLPPVPRRHEFEPTNTKKRLGTQEETPSSEKLAT